MAYSVQSTVYSVYAVGISSVLCDDLLLQPLVAVVYIALAAVAICFYLRLLAFVAASCFCLRLRCCSLNGLLFKNNISCCGVFSRRGFEL